MSRFGRGALPGPKQVTDPHETELVCSLDRSTWRGRLLLADEANFA